MKYILFLLTYAFAANAVAAGGDPNHIPTKMVILQVINFTLFCAVLTILLKSKVKAMFASRKEDFHAARIKAEDAKKEAQEQQANVREKLEKLEASATETIEKAKAEADQLRATMMKDAEDVSARIRTEAENATKNAVEKAKEELRQEVLVEAVEAARKVIAGNIAEPDQQRLNNEFVDKIQVVRQ